MFSKQGPSPRGGRTEEGACPAPGTGRKGVSATCSAGRRLPGWEDTPTTPEPQPGLGSPLGALSTLGAAHGHQGMSVRALHPPVTQEQPMPRPAGCALWRRADKQGSCSGLPPEGETGNRGTRLTALVAGCLLRMSWLAPGPGQGVSRGPDPQAQVRSRPGPPASLRLKGLYVQCGIERPQGALVTRRDTAPSWAASSDSEPVRQPEQRSQGRGQALTWLLAMLDPSPGSRRLGDSPRWRRHLCCSIRPDPRAGGTPYKLRSLAGSWQQSVGSKTQQVSF